MNELKKRIQEDLEKKQEEIVCCGASMLGGYFVDYKKRGNTTGISCTGYSHVTDEDREYVKNSGIKFFDFAALKDDTTGKWLELMHEHEELLKLHCY